MQRYPSAQEAGGTIVDILAETLVDTVMRDRPSTLRVFLDHGFRCVGCHIAPFHTIDEACREHRVDVGAFLGRLSQMPEAEAVSQLGPDTDADGDG